MCATGVEVLQVSNLQVMIFQMQNKNITVWSKIVQIISVSEKCNKTKISSDKLLYIDLKFLNNC